VIIGGQAQKAAICNIYSEAYRKSLPVPPFSLLHPTLATYAETVKQFETLLYVPQKPKAKR
jgi:hypothetical protein